ncbi:asparagine synthase-related protein, partial [Salmonella enterica]|uniref:asparagine synthase-related protein n=1 Tax=Salmonella enterica TaxID=28901 RepID=UPI003D28C53F
MRIHLLHRNRSYRAENTAQLRALYGVDYIAPIGDLRLIEFCLAIPNDQFRRNGQSRLLARRMLEAAGIPPMIARGEQRGI